MIGRLLRITTWVLAGCATAAAAQTATPRPCLSGPEAEAVFLALAPATIRVAGVSCGGTLPANALLRQPGGPFLDKLQAASDGAWPAARAAVTRFVGPDIAPLLESDVMRPMLGSLIAPLVLSGLKPADCPRLDRILTLLAPLPARNIAALGVTILQYAQDDARRRGRPAKLPLCPAQP